MNRRGSSFSLHLALMAVILGSAARTPAAELLAHGTDEMYWVARIVPPPQAAPERGETTVIRGRSVGIDATWREIARPAGRVVSIAHRQRELAALLENGQWMLLWPGGSALGALPDDGARLLALASGDQSVWAIGTGGRVEPATAPATMPDSSDSDATASPSEESSATTERGELSLYQLERGRWIHRGWLPADVVREDLPGLSMAIVRGRPMFSLLRFGGRIETFGRGDGEWIQLDPLTVADARQIKLLSDGDGAMLWVAPDTGAGRIYLRGTEWSEPRELPLKGPLGNGAPRTTALVGNTLRLLFVHDGRLFEQRFTRDGAATEAAAELPALAPETVAVPNRVLTALAAAMLVIVVLSSMRRGGGAASVATASEAGIRPAPLLFRFVAGVIDASPLLITMFLLFRNLDPQAREFEQLLDSMTYPFYTALAAYLLYTWLAETLFGRTVGKMLFGLRVVSLDGTRPSAGAIFARNALRLVDVTMLAIPLILVILSPLHQRVGDIAGRTIVVSGTPNPAENPDESSQKS